MSDDCPSRLRAIPHMYTHLVSYPPRASKASDIAHLLDPSYSPTPTACLNQIYVDHAGEAHDPDFRLFAPAAYSPNRRDFLSCDDDDDVLDEGVALYPRRASFDSARSAHRPDSRASDPVYTRSPHADSYAAFAYTFEEPQYVSDDEPPREANKLRRRRASLEHDRPLPHPQPVPDPALTHPTTSPGSFRRQWHAWRLRTQVAAFRARKRATHLISPSAG